MGDDRQRRSPPAIVTWGPANGGSSRCEDRVALQLATGESFNDSPAAATSAATAAAAEGGE